MSKEDGNEIFARLAAPFPREAVSWRAQTLTKDGTKALALAYIDARDVMNRLDEVIGPMNWQDSYVETPAKRVICTIALRASEEAWVSKSDGSGATDVEGEKGAISGAFKRAAVRWGIGRYLYDMPDKLWVPCKTYDAGGKKKFDSWTVDPWQIVDGKRPPEDVPSNADTAPTDDRILRACQALEGAPDMAALHATFTEIYNSWNGQVPDEITQTKDTMKQQLQEEAA